MMQMLLDQGPNHAGEQQGSMQAQQGHMLQALVRGQATGTAMYCHTLAVPATQQQLSVSVVLPIC